MMASLPSLMLLFGCGGSPEPRDKPAPAPVPTTPAPQSTGPRVITDHSPTPAPVPTADTAVLPPAVVDTPDVRIEQAGNPAYIGMGGQIRLFDFLGDARLEIVTGGIHTQTFVWTLPLAADTTPADALILPGGGLDIWAHDVDGDGRRDLIQHDGGFDTLWTVSFSPYGVPTRQTTIFANYVVKPSVCVRDLDGDGHLDLSSMWARELWIWHGPFPDGSRHEEPDQIVSLTADRFSDITFIHCEEDLSGDGVVDLLTVKGPLNLFTQPVIPRDVTEVATPGQAFPYDAIWLLPTYLDRPTQPGSRAVVFGATDDDGADRYRIISLPVDLDNPDVVGKIERGHTDLGYHTGDLNGDGFDDFAVTGGDGVRIFYGPLVGDRPEDDYDVQVLGDIRPMSFAIADLDLDGADDLVVAGDGNESSDDAVHVYFGPLPERGQGPPTP